MKSKVKSQKSKVVITVFAILFSNFGFSQTVRDTGKYSFSVQQAIDFSMKNQTQVQNASYDEQIAQYKVKEYDTCILPTIDFQKYTLISLKTQFGGCQETPIIRQVLRDDSQKKITYKVTVSGCGDCAKNHSYMNWLKIPKVNFDYQILYDKHIGHINTNDSCK